MGPVGRLRRSAVQVQKTSDTVFAATNWPVEFDLLLLRRSREPYRLAPPCLFSSLMLTSEHFMTGNCNNWKNVRPDPAPDQPPTPAACGCNERRRLALIGDSAVGEHVD